MSALTTMAFPSIVKPEEREGEIRVMGNPLGTIFRLDESTISTYLVGATSPIAASLSPAMNAIGAAAALTTDVDLRFVEVE